MISVTSLLSSVISNREVYLKKKKKKKQRPVKLQLKGSIPTDPVTNVGTSMAIYSVFLMLKTKAT